MTKNDHLVPELIRDIITKYISGSQGEQFTAEARMIAIRDLINKHLGVNDKQNRRNK